ncbi:Ig-like domain-containing protein, partial [Vibrio alginolyticus]|nr:Ig-like domain-containing protein [Vibrio alginolyticus]
LLYSDGKVADVTAEPAWSWSSNNRNIATVDSDTGVVTAVNDGLVTITISGEMDGLEWSEGVELTVSEATPQALQVTPVNDSLPKGLTKAFKAALLYSDGKVVDVTADPAWSWSSDSHPIATVDSDTGVVTAINGGLVTITISGEMDGLKWSEGVELTVSEATPQALQVTPVNDSLPKGLTKAFKAALLYSDGKVADVTAEPAWSWSSNDRNIATVDSDTGVVTAVNDGLVTITISGEMDGLKWSEGVELTVSEATPQALQVTPVNDSLPKGLTKAFKAALLYSDGKVVDVTADPAWSWSSDSHPIATVDSDTGVVTAINGGLVTITISGEMDGLEWSEGVELTVS